MESVIRLTQFSHGAGCGCKIAPAVLEEILKGSVSLPDTPALLVGNRTKDDAAVYDLGNGTALISTTDFFMPIVDDPVHFGRIAAANAISDVYAMGGKPLLAIAILGWPVEKLSADIARQVIDGGKEICGQAGIPLAGGHSIDSPEPIFGLAVTGIVPLENLKRNDTAREGDLLFLTKPLGVGILSTAQKRDQLHEEDKPRLFQQLATLNKVGEEIGKIRGVSAMTDVTGFGFLGHLLEMAEGSGLSAEVSYAAIPKLPHIGDYISRRIFPDATTRNWSSYGTQVKFEKGVNVMEAFTLLPDPQTNGGLLIAVNPEHEIELIEVLKKYGLDEHTQSIGKILPASEKRITIIP